MHTVIVHTIRLGEIEDPDLFVAQRIWEWQQTDMGIWIMNNAIQKPIWHRCPDSYGWMYTIEAELAPKNYTYWWIKWGHTFDCNNVK